MNKIFNSRHLLAQNKWMTPWKFIFNYRYKNHTSVNDVAFVSVTGTTDKNERVDLFKYELLYRQPDNTSDAYVTTSIINTVDKKIVDMNVEILNYEYLDLKIIDAVIRPRSLPTSSNSGDVLESVYISILGYDITLVSDDSIKYIITNTAKTNDEVYKNGTVYSTVIDATGQDGNSIYAVAYNSTAISDVSSETIGTFVTRLLPQTLPFNI